MLYIEPSYINRAKVALVGAKVLLVSLPRPSPGPTVGAYELRGAEELSRETTGTAYAPQCLLYQGDQVCSLSTCLSHTGDSLWKNWGREEEGGVGCFSRTEVLGRWQHLKVLMGLF